MFIEVRGFHVSSFIHFFACVLPTDLCMEFNKDHITTYKLVDAITETEFQLPLSFLYHDGYNSVAIIRVHVFKTTTTPIKATYSSFHVGTS